MESPEDFYASELLAQRAFWNKHHPGCDEHLLVHKLRGDAAYLPEISRVAEADGKIVGSIMYSRSRVVNENNQATEVITFGPLCVDPDYQGLGIGGLLLNETLRLAKDAGFRAIIIYGEPDYYPRFGFKTCDHFGITTPEGKNFDAFMGIELVPDGFKEVQGKFYEAEVFQNLPPGEVDAYSQKFPLLEKQHFPFQWD
jgi:predicted N-acetyltransferase YhbS